MSINETNDELVQGFSRNPKRYAAVLLAAGIIFASCGSESSQADADDSTTADAVEAVAVIEDTEAETETETETETEVDAIEEDVADTVLDGAPPQDGNGPPDGAGGPPPDGAGPPPDGAGEPPAVGGADAGDDETLLTTGPQNVGEHGPFSNADFDGDGAVTRD